MKVCGNLDVDHLAIVKRNISELQRIVPVPRECKRIVDINILYLSRL